MGEKSRQNVYFVENQKEIEDSNRTNTSYNLLAIVPWNIEIDVLNTSVIRVV